MRDTIGEAVCEGIVSRYEHGLSRAEQLYRRTWLHRLAWRAGWEFANLATRRPLRTARRKPKQGPLRSAADGGVQ